MTFQLTEYVILKLRSNQTHKKKSFQLTEIVIILKLINLSLVTFQVTKKVRILWIKHIIFYTHGKYTSHSIIMAVIDHYLMEKQFQKETKLNFELFVICLTNDL